MATDWAKKQDEPVNPPQKTPTRNEEAHLKVIRDRFAAADSKDSNERDKAEQDLLFLDGEEQWDAYVRQVREDDKRPCITVNKLPTFLDQIVGEQRQNRASIKCIGVDSVSDPEVADIFTGLIRNIEVTSKAKEAYDTAYECAAACGRGWIKVVTEYCGQDVFDQHILIKRVGNPFVVYWDPSASEYDLNDGWYMFESEAIPRDEFKERFPDAQVMDFEELPADKQPWFEDECVRIANYYEKELEEVMIYLREDGIVTREDPGKNSTVKKRKAKVPKISHYLVTGLEIIEGPNKWASRYFPLIPVWGKELNINGERRMRGLVRNAQDSQRMYNYFRSAAVESVALAPKSPFILTPEQIANHEDEWQTSHHKAWPYLLYNHEEGQPPPQRQYPEPLNTAIAAEVQISNQDMRDTTNVQEASLGMVSNERSGAAIEARKSQGDRGAFPFQDNLARAQEQVGRVLVDLIPTIYDTNRIVRVLGEDGTERFVPVNVKAPELQATQARMGGRPMNGRVNAMTQVLNDLTVGKYDVVVTTGPSVSTRRQEAANSLISLANAIPQAGPIISDMIVQNLDIPHAQRLAKRLKKTVPPQLLDPGELEEGELPPPPDPMQDPQVVLKLKELALKEKDLRIKSVEAMSKAILNIAKAEGVEAGQQIQLYTSYVQAIEKLAEKEIQMMGPQQQGPPQGQGGM